MKRPARAALAATLVLSSSAALAASGDAWYGTNQYREYAPVEVTTLRPGERVIVYEANASSSPVYVERTFIREPGYVYYYEPREVDAYRADDDWVKDLNPQTGHRIGDGLFNRQGPNDFGQ